MTEETAANPAGEADTHVAAPAPAAPEAQAPAEGTAPETSPAPEPEEEFEEIERGEKKYRIPKALKGELLMHQDYTRKTMELADQRREVDRAKAEVEQAKSLTTEERRAYAKLEILAEQVAAYEKVDWGALEAADPQEAQKHWRLYQTALNQRNQTAQALHLHESQKTQRAQQEAAKRRETVEAEVAKAIPNWSPARKAELEQFASQYGYTPQALAENAGVEDYKLLHFAHEGFKFIERQKAAARAAASQAVKPAPEVGGTAAAGSDPNRMSMDEYVAARRAGKI